MNQNQFKPTNSLRHFAIWIGTICFLAAFSMVTQPPVAHAQDCPSFPIDVSNTTELNEAIACYNTAAAGTYNITIMADFTITEATPRVNNPNGAVLDINGNGKTIDGADSFRFLTIDRSTVNIASITLQNTRHADSGRDECFSETCGGAIALFGSGNANVLDSKILNSDAFFGGGIWNRGGTLTVENSYFSGNAANDGGGIYSEREAIIKGSTFDNNQAIFGGAIMPAFFGSYDIVNNTFSNNTATINGGGMRVAFIQNQNRFNLHNNTFFGNSAPDGANVRIEGTNPFSIKNNIFADGSGGDNCFSQRTIDATNISTDASCDSATQSTNISLGPLQDNGGPTFTHALLAGSDAIDAGDDTICTNEPVNGIDQRGVARPFGPACDVGAYEQNNVAPVATDDTYATDEDTALTVNAPGLLSNDTDSDPLTAVLDNGPSNGTLTLNADGSFTYLPNANFNGSDSFTYTANDGSADSNIATVSITVNAVNDAPVAADDSYTSDEDTPLVESAPGVLINDSDVDSATLTAVLDSDPSNGTVALNADGSFTYTPNANFNGSDSFTYKANDGSADSNVATVTININAVPDAPVAGDDNYATDEDTTLTVPAPGILTNDSDIDGDGLSVFQTGDVSNGTLILNDDGSFTYTPNAGFTGDDSFTYVALSGGEGSGQATVTITVVSTNSAPVAADMNLSTDEGIALPFTLAGSDADGDFLSYNFFSMPSNGTLNNIAPNLTYIPDAGFSGVDSFIYQACDGLECSNMATVTIAVNAVAAPFATCGGYDVFETSPGAYEAPSFAGTLIVGTNGKDWLNGTSGPDLILGLDKADDIWGKDGDDVICGGLGKDIIEGQKGNDTLFGEMGADWLIGGPDNDTLYGGKGWDDLEGNGGMDMLYGEEGYDVLLGGKGSDELFGGENRDDLYGNRGDDALNGGNGNDFCKGGPGSDTIDECEGASSASVESSEEVEFIDEDAARRDNDGENGEHTIEQRIQDLYLPMIANSGQ